LPPGRSKRLADLALADVQVKLERKELGFQAKDKGLADFILEYLAYSKSNKARQSYGRDTCIIKNFTDFVKAACAGILNGTHMNRPRFVRSRHSSNWLTLMSTAVFSAKTTPDDRALLEGLANRALVTYNSGSE